MSTSSPKKRRNVSLLAGIAATSLTAGLVLIPQADAETKTNLSQPLACNLQLKDPGAIPLGQASGVEGVYNAANKQYSNFKITMASTSAPDTVAPGEEFEYVINAGTVGVPAQIKAAVTANVSRVSQLNMWYELPENAEYVSHSQSGGLADVKVEKVGNKLRIWIPEPLKGSKDVTKWTKTGKGDYVHGGAEATKSGDYFNIAIPKVTIKLKATGEPGSTIQAGFPKVDADKFGSDLPIQFYADASAKLVFSSISANGFIRCGLSEDDTYWPREKNGTNLPSDKFSAVSIVAPEKTPDNEANDPKAKGAVTITEGDALPDAKAQIADFANLPAGTTAAWATTHTNVGDNQDGKITVTYPDKTTDTVAIKVNVKKKATQAETFEPQAKGAVTITEGDALPDAKAQIADFANLPAGTTAAWATTHTNVGDNQDGKITVTYPDKTTDTVAIKVNVKKKATQAETFDPQAKGVVEITEGDALPKAEDQIAEFGSLPSGTKAAWATTHTEVKDGQAGKITVTYPDNSTDTVSVTVNVKKKDDNLKYDPKAKAPVTIIEGKQLPEAKDQIADFGDLPAGTTAAWASEHKTVGDNQPGKITVTYPDDTADTVEIVVNVKASLASQNDPKAKGAVTITQGDELPTAADQIADFDKLPAGTKAEWTSTHTEVRDNQTGTIEVTYSDGSTDTVRLAVNVKAVWEPQGKANVTQVKTGTAISDEDAKAQITNANDAPAGTTFVWKTKPDTTTAAENVEGVVTVTVPGKDAVDITVTYLVQDELTWLPQADEKTKKVEVGAKIDATDAKAWITNADAADAPQDATYEWVETPDTATPGEKTGTIKITAGEKTYERTVKYNVVTVYAPKAVDKQDVEIGTTVENNATTAEAHVANAADAPFGTTFEWVKVPATDKVGESKGTIKVTAPDKDAVELEVVYNVTSSYAPTVKQGAEVAIGTEIKPEGAKALITNAAKAPAGTTFEWGTQPKTDKVGEAKGTIKVTVPGKDAVEVPVTIKVTSTYMPVKKSTATEVEQGASIKDEDAKAQFTNADQAPAGTTFAWKTKPVTTEAGPTTGVVTIAVPGAEPQDITVNYTVKAKSSQPDPESPAPTTTVTETESTSTPPTTTVTETESTATPTTTTVTETSTSTSPTTTSTSTTTEEPAPAPTTDKKVTVLVKGANGQAAFKPGDTLTVNVNGVDKELTVGADGKVEIKDGDLPAGIEKFEVKVKDTEGKESIWTVDLKKGTAKKKLSTGEIVGAVLGSIFGIAAIALSFIPIPGMKEAITNFQKQAGFFNPELAGMVEKAQPIVGSLAGIAILGGVLGTTLGGKVEVKVENK